MILVPGDLDEEETTGEGLTAERQNVVDPDRTRVDNLSARCPVGLHTSRPSGIYDDFRGGVVKC